MSRLSREEQCVVFVANMLVAAGGLLLLLDTSSRLTTDNASMPQTTEDTGSGVMIGGVSLMMMGVMVAGGWRLFDAYQSGLNFVNSLSGRDNQLESAPKQRVSSRQRAENPYWWTGMIACLSGLASLSMMLWRMHQQVTTVAKPDGHFRISDGNSISCSEFARQYGDQRAPLGMTIALNTAVVDYCGINVVRDPMAGTFAQFGVGLLLLAWAAISCGVEEGPAMGCSRRGRRMPF